MSQTSVEGWIDADSLVHRMRKQTTALHRQAERTGIVKALLRGTISAASYALYLRNLLPAYAAMEHALRHHRNQPILRDLALPVLYRSEALAADLDGLAGPQWASTVPLLPAGQCYADRVIWAASGDAGVGIRKPGTPGSSTAGARLIAHCYTRYLGDLSGGQILARRLATLFGEDFPALSFTQFPHVADLRDLAARYCVALNRAGARLGNAACVVEEAAIAFQKNIAVSQAVAAHVGQADDLSIV